MSCSRLSEGAIILVLSAVATGLLALAGSAERLRDSRASVSPGPRAAVTCIAPCRPGPAPL